MITVQLPPRPIEQISFETSRLAELAHSWHVLADPGHHALQIPWVRRCRDLPASLRRHLREWRWVVQGYVPALFEVGAGHPDLDIDDELAAVAALDPAVVSGDLANAIVSHTAWEGTALAADGELAAAAVADIGARDAAQGRRLATVLAEPMAVLDDLLALAHDYWDAAFAEEWAQQEPDLLEAVERAGVALARGVAALLTSLTPEISLDPGSHSFRVDRQHDHRVDVEARGRISFTPSYFSWPHVRVTCESDWPLRLTYPVVPLSPRDRRGVDPESLGPALRALAAPERLEILRLVSAQPRSTQELAGLLGMSAAAVSRHLRLLHRESLLDARREGHYVLYGLGRERVATVGRVLSRLAGE